MVLKKIISWLPADLPAKVYRQSRYFPGLQKMLGKAVQLTIPPKIRIEEGDIWLEKTDITVSGPIALHAYENTQVDLFRKVIEPGMTVIDIGAHIGYYSVIAGRRVGDKGKVFSFEPEEHNFSLLSKNIAGNNIGWVEPIPIAIGEQEGVAHLFINTTNKGNHSLVSRASSETKEVPLSTLDRWLDERKITKVDVIKLDIEGAEMRAFKGMRKTLANNPGVKIFMEFYPEALRAMHTNPIDLLNAITAEGFSMWAIDEKSRKKEKITNTTEFANALRPVQLLSNLYLERVTLL